MSGACGCFGQKKLALAELRRAAVLNYLAVLKISKKYRKNHLTAGGIDEREKQWDVASQAALPSAVEKELPTKTGPDVMEGSGDAGASRSHMRGSPPDGPDALPGGPDRSRVGSPCPDATLENGYLLGLLGDGFKSSF